GLSDEEAGRFTAFLLGLHDLGKASVPFQRKYEPKMQRLREMGMPFGPSIEIPHGIVSGMALGYKGKGMLSSSSLTNKRAAALLAQAIGGHHGTWPSPSQLKEADDASF